MTPFFCAFKIGVQFSFEFHLQCVFYLHLHFNISYFANVSFPLICRSSMMKNWQTCPLIIQQKLCITFDCNSWENMALICTQQCSMITFMLSNNLLCIHSICKVVHLVMDFVRMNCCCKWLEGLVIMLDLWWLWQITCLSHPSQISLCILKVKRFLGL